MSLGKEEGRRMKEVLIGLLALATAPIWASIVVFVLLPGMVAYVIGVGLLHPETWRE